MNRTLGITTAKTDHKPINGTDQLKWIGEWIITLLRRISLTEKVYCERRELLKLSDEQLADIGINRSDVRKECNRHLMDIPENRKKDLFAPARRGHRSKLAY